MSLPMPFGNPYTYAGHSGVDFPQRLGTPFRASGPGTIVNRTYNEFAGNTVWVQYDGVRKAVGYAHMNNWNGVPNIGVRVTEGTLLGYVGNKGKRVTGPHLHVESAANATTAGFYNIFNRNDVVGATPSTPTPSGGADAGGAVAGVNGPNPFGIPFTGGLQKIARLNGYGTKFGNGALDQNWGSYDPVKAAKSGSMRGFAQFLRAGYGYVGDDVLGPSMWSAIARWLRATKRYSGNDIPGPQMRAALAKADTENWQQLK